MKKALLLAIPILLAAFAVPATCEEYGTTEYWALRRNARVDQDLRLEQEADIMFGVYRKELDRRGCSVSEFGDV